jgi:hypothetical protein
MPGMGLSGDYSLRIVQVSVLLPPLRAAAQGTPRPAGVGSDMKRERNHKELERQERRRRRLERRREKAKAKPRSQPER